jgi:hypothetical protein
MGNPNPYVNPHPVTRFSGKVYPSPNDGTYFTPAQERQAHSMARRNNPLGLLGDHLEHWLGLKQTAQEGAQMFDPRSRAGVANILSMFVGGGDFTGEGGMGMENPGMPGKFESYSMSKSPVRFSEGQPHDMAELLHKAVHSPNEAQRLGAAKMLHDQLFGGEVHARGDIPARPGSTPPKTTDAVVQGIADKLGIHPSKVEAQMRAAAKGNRNSARQANIARQLHNHGFEPYRPEEHPEASPARASTRRNDLVSRTKGSPMKPHLQRQVALRELLKQHFNHPN